MKPAGINLRKVTVEDAEQLLDFSKKTFYEFFSGMNEPANMEIYSSVAFTIEKITAEITNTGSLFYFAMLENQVIGYLKLNFKSAQTESRDENALEIERVYVTGEHHGKHIGSLLLNFAIATAISMQLAYVWLGVWEHNHKAIGFYRYSGFEIFGKHQFLLGDDRQTDLLMKKVL